SIGLSADGISPLPNGRDGIYFTNQPSFNLIGGTNTADANFIAFNGRNGIALAASAGSGNCLLGNSISSNAALGNDLNEDGVTLNDDGHSDSGPNGIPNYTILTEARFADGATTISGVLTSSPSTTFRLEFYLSDNPDPSA